MLRANDTNHWLLIIPGRPPDHDYLVIVIRPWNSEAAELANARHACGIDCGLKITAALIADNFFPSAIPSTPQAGQAGKDVADVP